MKKLFIFAVLIATACTPDEQPEKCGEIVARGYDGKCWIQLKNGKRIYETCDKYNVGQIYCE